MAVRVAAPACTGDRDIADHRIPAPPNISTGLNACIMTIMVLTGPQRARTWPWRRGPSRGAPGCADRESGPSRQVDGWPHRAPPRPAVRLIVAPTPGGA